MMRDALKEDLQTIISLGGGASDREMGGEHVWVGVGGLVESLRGEGYNLGRHAAAEDAALLVCMLEGVRTDLWASISEKVASLKALHIQPNRHTKSQNHQPQTLTTSKSESRHTIM